ncbi:hypothetical protein [Methylomonas lenta]|uniref:hypothetical protein n=1 Tax=Methylomonas lenta TaxID=980561 RepID=UPI0018DC5207|nr:hypothetical protein [Methylomonas lenta]
MEDLTEKLETYYRNSKTEFSFGVQNFQGIREYTKIPLAALTLLYGQNSAGKSTIHDIQEFIVGFFSHKWDAKTTADHLGRWANHFRHFKPLTKGYLINAQNFPHSRLASRPPTSWRLEAFRTSTIFELAFRCFGKQ